MIIKKFLLVYINLMQHVLYFLLAEDGQFLDFFSACKVESESEGKKIQNLLSQRLVCLF